MQLFVPLCVRHQSGAHVGRAMLLDSVIVWVTGPVCKIRSELSHALTAAATGRVSASLVKALSPSLSLVLFPRCTRNVRPHRGAT